MTARRANIPEFLAFLNARWRATSYLSMIFSENRFTLFGIML